MTTDVLERPVAEPPADNSSDRREDDEWDGAPEADLADDDDDDDSEHHVYCCDPNRALCGLDLSTFTEVDEWSTSLANFCWVCFRRELQRRWCGPLCGPRRFLDRLRGR